MGKLTTRKVDSLKEPGMYSDGDGLYLRIGPNGSKSWILRTRIAGRVTGSGSPLRWEGGLGGLGLVSLAEAREKARELRKVARAGGNPAKTRDRRELTFEEAARAHYDQLRPTWRNGKHADDWLNALINHAFPRLGSQPLQSIGTEDVLQVLVPIWVDRNETAKRVRQRIGSTFDWAIGAGHYTGANPVGPHLSKALPRVRAKPMHHAALPWQELPGLMSELKARDGTSARCLEWIILTAARSGEARGATWAEIEGATWTVPAARMKAGEPHAVPLPDAALAVLDKVKGLDDRLVFPSPQMQRDKTHKELSVNAFGALFRRLGIKDVTAHGFRSTFRVWAAEVANAPREVAEAALAHQVGSAVERAYQRSDLFERRRVLMQRWALFCLGHEGSVVRIA